MYRHCIKPVFDWVIALSAIIILLPVLVIVSAVIKIDSPGPVFFCQNRLGQNGRIFKIFKFRSMWNEVTAQGGETLYESDPRITHVGKILRKTSLDELPQLINILKGEMSFIGPRPPVTSYPKKYEDYTDFERKRFEVKPGISGLAAVKCREIHDWNINIPIDVEYVNTISFLNDMKLFIISLSAFLRTDNIYSRK